MENLLVMPHGRARREAEDHPSAACGTAPFIAYRLRDSSSDCGAYADGDAFLPSLTRLMTPGPYNILRAESWSTSVVTNTTPVGAYRGAGRPEAAAAVDRAMDLFADAAGVDPAEVRRKNLLPKFTEPLTTAFGAKYDSGDYVGQALEKALDAGRLPGPARRAGRRAAPQSDTLQLGIGIASYVEITGPRAAKVERARTRTAPSRCTPTAPPPC